MEALTEPSYTCRESHCLATGPATEMMNVACRPYRLTPQELKKLILCKSCAHRFSRTNNRGQSGGARVFSLQVTLEIMIRSAKEAMETASYLRWYLEKAPITAAIRQSRGDYERQYLSWYYDRNPQASLLRLPSREDD